MKRSTNSIVHALAIATRYLTSNLHRAMFLAILLAGTCSNVWAISPVTVTRSQAIVQGHDATGCDTVMCTFTITYIPNIGSNGLPVQTNLEFDVKPMLDGTALYASPDPNSFGWVDATSENLPTEGPGLNGGSINFKWSCANGNGLTGGTYTLHYSAVLPCINISTDHSPLFQISYIRGGATLDCNTVPNSLDLSLLGNISGTGNSVESPGFSFPNLVIQGPSQPVAITPGTSVCIENKITNPGTLPYSGPLYFDGTITSTCGINISNTQVYVINGNTTTQIPLTHWPVDLSGAIPTVPCTAPSCAPNTTQISVKECFIPGCSTAVSSCTSAISLGWEFQCPHNIAPASCNSSNYELTLTKAIEGGPHLSIYRLAPKPNPSDVQGNTNQDAWDNTCMGAEEKWKYIIVNDGNFAAQDVSIQLNNGDPASYTLLDGSPSVTFPVTSDNNLVFSTSPTPATTTFTAIPLTGTSSCITNLAASTNGHPALQTYTVNAASLSPNQFIELNFATFRCCPGNDLNFIFNEGASFNRWMINTSFTDCSGSATYSAEPGGVNATVGGVAAYPPFSTSNNTHPYISSVSSDVIDGSPDLYMVQEYIPGNANLTGETCQTPGSCPAKVCPGSPQSFQIINKVFSSFSSTSGDGNVADDFDTQLYSGVDIPNTGNPPTPTGSIPGGQFLIFFTIEEGAQLDPASTPSITNPAFPGVNWQPVFGSYSSFYRPNTVVSTDPIILAHIPAQQIGQTMGRAIFDINSSTLGSIASTSQQFRDFMKGSIITFSLVGTCPICSPQANVDVQTSFNPLPKQSGTGCAVYYNDVTNQPNLSACMIPLSKVDFPVYLHCPGCVTPGLTTDYTIIRDINNPHSYTHNTIGYQDDNDIGVPTGTNNGGTITLNYTKNPKIKADAAIAGDLLTGTATGTFIDGSKFDYASMLAGPNPAPFTHLYLEQDIQQMQNGLALNGNNVNLVCVGATLQYISNGVAHAPVNLPALPVGNTSVANYTCFLFGVDIRPAPFGLGTQLGITGNISENPNHDQFILKAEFIARDNPATNTDLVFNNYMYFTTGAAAINATTSPDPNRQGNPYLQAGAIYQTITNGQTYEQNPGAYAHALYYCDAQVGNATIFPVVPVINENWTTNNSCQNSVTWQVGYQIANTIQQTLSGHATNVNYQDAFPFEYRIVPQIDQAGNLNYAGGNIPVSKTFTGGLKYGAEINGPASPLQLDFTVPQDFIATFNNVFGVAPYYSGETSSPIPPGTANMVNSPFNMLPTSIGTIVGDGTTVNTITVNPALVSFAPPIANGNSGQYYPGLYIGDESFVQSIQFNLQRVCSTATTPTVVTGLVYGDIPDISTSANSAVAVPVTSAANSNIYTQVIGEPDPTINATQTSVTYGNGTITFNFTVQSDYDASNFELYISNSNLASYNSNALVIPGTGAITSSSFPNIIENPNALDINNDPYYTFNVGNLTGGRVYTFSLTLGTPTCGQQTASEQSFLVNYTWDCTMFQADPATRPRSCATRKPITLNTNFSLQYIPDCSVSGSASCQPVNYNFTFTNTGLSALFANGLAFTFNGSLTNITLPSYYTVTILNSITHATSTYTTTASVLGPGTYNIGANQYTYYADFSSFNLNTLPLNTDDIVTVSFSLIPGCNTIGTTGLPGVTYQFNYSAYCGAANPYPQPKTFTPTASITNGCDYANIIQSLCTPYTYTVVLGVSTTQEAAAIAGPVTVNGGTGGASLQQPPQVSVGSVYTTYTYQTQGWQLSTTSNPVQYTVSFTDVAGCSVTSQPVTMPTAAEDEAPYVTLGSTNPTCNGTTGGTAFVIPAQTGPPGMVFNYEWSGGCLGGVNTHALITNLCAGTYTITAVDVNDGTCSVTANVILYNGPTFALSYVINCTGGNATSATVSVNNPAGGTPPYSYYWLSTGQTTPTIHGVPLGSTPGVLVFDATGNCVSYGQVNIPTQAFDLNPSFTNPLCNLHNGSAQVSPMINPANPDETSDAPYTILWNNGSTLQNYSLAGIGAGTYKVTVTDGNGCKETKTFTLTSNNVLPVAAGVNKIQCWGGTGSINITGSGGTLPYTYHWSPNTTYTSDVLTGNNSISQIVYTITVDDHNGCNGTVTATLPAEPSEVIATVTTTNNASCAGTADGELTCTVIPADAGTPGYIYLWSNQATGSHITGLLPGTYTVTVTDAHGCTTSTSGVVGVSVPVVTLVAVQNEKCYGAATGQIQVTPAPTGQTYTYAWPDPYMNAATESGLVAGNYIITVTTGPGCTATVSATITEPAQLNVQMAATDIPCYHGANTGTVSATVSGGTPGVLWGYDLYQYQWSNLAPGYNWNLDQYNQTGLGAGHYTVTVEDINGCSVTAEQNVLIPATPLTGAVSFICSPDPALPSANDYSAFATACGGTPTYTYTWSQSNVQPLSPDFGHVYDVNYWALEVTITDANGCTAVANYTPPSVTIAAPANAYCGGSVNALSATAINGTPFYPNNHSTSDCAPNGGAEYNYTWSGVGNFTPNPAVTSTDDASMAGIYTVTATDAGGCTATATGATLPGSQSLSVLIASSGFVCENNQTTPPSPSNNGTATAVASGGTPGYTYSWSNLQAGATASSLTTGTYGVTVTDANGCTASASVSISLDNLSVNITSSLINPCGAGGGDEQFNIQSNVSGGNNAYSYNWSNGSALSGIISGNLGREPTLSYTLTVTDGNCCQVTSSVTVSYMHGTPLYPHLTQTNSTCNNSNAQVTVSVIGGTPGFTYLWSTGSTSSTGIYNLPAGYYSITVTDHNGCVQSSSVAISDNNVTAYGYANFSTANGIVYCSPPNAYLGYSHYPASANLTMVWTEGNTIINPANPVGPGYYNGMLTDQNTGCKFATSVQVSASVGTPQVTLTETNESCFNSNNGIIDITNVTNGMPPYTYLWQNNSTANHRTGLAPGTYSVTVTDAYGCKGNSSATIGGPLAPLQVSVTALPGRCTDGTNVINSTATGGTPCYSYLWSNGKTTPDISNAVAGTYTLTVTDGKNCTATATTTIYADPIISLTGTEPSCYNGTNGSASVMVANTSSGPFSFTWSQGANIYSQTDGGLGTGIYTVTVNNTYCSATGSIYIGQPLPFEANINTVDESCGVANSGSATVSVINGHPFHSQYFQWWQYDYNWSRGNWAVPFDFSNNLSEGNISVTVTDANGCTATATGYVGNAGGSFTVNASVTNLDCYDHYDMHTGSVTANVTPATGSYTYSWANSSGTIANSNVQTLTGLGYGTYHVTVTSNTYPYCSATAQVYLPDNSFNTNIRITGTNNICYGSSTVLSVSTGPYVTYKWSDGTGTNISTSNTVNVTPPYVFGNAYSVTVSNSEGCTFTASTEIYTISATFLGSTDHCEPADPPFPLFRDCVPVNVLVYGASPITATPVFSWPGDLPGNYSPFSGNATFCRHYDGTSVNNYTVNCTFSQGNCLNQTISEQITFAPIPTVSIGESPSVRCVAGGTPVTLTANANNTGPGINTYAWGATPAPIPPNNGNVAYATPYASTTYDVTVTSPYGCTASASKAVNLCPVIHIIPWVPFPFFEMVCANTRTEVDFTGVTSNGAVGDYIEVSQTPDFAAYQTIPVPANISVMVGPDSTDTLYLRRLNGTTGDLTDYSFTTASVISNYTAPAAPASQIAYADVAVPFTFNNVGAGGCPGDYIAWSTRSDFAGAMVGLAPVNATVTVDTNSTDTIWFRRQDSLGVVFTSGAVFALASVISPETPPVPPAPQSACSDTPVVFSFGPVTGFMDDSDSTATDSIQWSFASDFSNSITLADPATIMVSVYPGTIDTIWMRSVDTLGDTSGASFTTAAVNSQPVMPAPPAPQTACADTPVTFTFDSVTASGCGGNLIIWSTSSNFSNPQTASSPANISIQVSPGQTDTIWIESGSSATGAVSPPVFTTVSVTDNPLPPVAPAAQSACSPDTAWFNFTGINSAGCGADEVEWSLQSNFANSQTASSPVGFYVGVGPRTTDTIWLRSVSSVTGDTSAATYTIARNNPEAGFSASAGNVVYSCAYGTGANVTLNITGGVSPYTFAWSNGQSVQNPLNLTSGTYYVTITDSLGCADTTSVAVSCNTACNIDSFGVACSKCYVGYGLYTVHIWNAGFAYLGSSGSSISVATSTGSIQNVANGPIMPGWNNILITGVVPTANTNLTDTITLTMVDSTTGDTCTAQTIVSLSCDSLSQFGACNGNLGLYNQGVVLSGYDSTTGQNVYAVTVAVVNNSQSIILGGPLAGYQNNVSNSNPSRKPWLLPGINIDTLYVEPASPTADSMCFTFGITDSSYCPVCTSSLCVPVPVATGCTIDSLGVLCTKCYIAYNDSGTIHHEYNLHYYYNGNGGPTSITVNDMYNSANASYSPSIVPGWNNLLVSVNLPAAVSGTDVLTVSIIDSLTNSSCVSHLGISLVCDSATGYTTCAGNFALYNNGIVYLGIDPGNGRRIYALTVNAVNNWPANIVGGVYSSTTGYKIKTGPGYTPILLPGSNIVTLYIEPSLTTTGDTMCLFFGVTDTSLCPTCYTPLCVTLPSTTPSCSITGLTLACGTCIPYGNIGSEHFWNMSFNYGGSNGSRMYWRTVSGNQFGSDNKTVENGQNVNLVISINPYSDTLPTDTVIITVVDSLTGDSCSQAVGFSILCGGGVLSQGGISNLLPECHGQYMFNVTGVYTNVVDPNNGQLTYMGTFDFTNTGTDTVGLAPVQCGTCVVNDASGGFVAPGVTHDTVYFTPLAPSITQVCYTFALFNQSICGVCAEQVCFNLASNPCGAGYSMNDTAFCAGDSICINVTGGTQCAVYVDSISDATLRFTGATPYAYCGNLNGSNSSGYHNVYIVVSIATPAGAVACTDTILTHYYMRPYCACGVTVDTCPELVANFGYTIYPGYVILKDKSTGSPTIVEWYVNGQNFVTGPGDTLKYVFAHSGLFEVCQTIHYLIYGSDQCCLKDTCMYIMGSVDTCLILNLTADFSYNQSNTAPYTYTFTPVWPANATPSVITWNFGDSTSTYSDTAVQATHSFDTAGYYDVCVNEIWFLPGNYCCIDSQCYQVHVGGIQPEVRVSPNPFQQTIIVQFQVNTAGKVELVVFDALGKSIKTLINSTTYASGYYTMEFDMSDLTDALYHYRFRSADGLFTGKMIKQ